VYTLIGSLTINAVLQKVAGVVFILAGINDIIAYWLI